MQMSKTTKSKALKIIVFVFCVFAVMFFAPKACVHAEKCTVVYYLNGGTGNIEPQSVNTGDYIQLPSPNESGISHPEGKKFEGWKIYGKNKTYDPGEPVQITKDTVVKAIWQNQQQDENKVVVAYEANNDSGSTYFEQIIKGKYQLQDNMFDPPEGATFDCWKINLDGPEYNSIYQPGDWVLIEQDTTVTAQWKEQTTEDMVTITYEDGYENEAAESQQVNRGKSISLPEYVGPTHEGQTFAGWKIPNDEKIYSVGANVSFNENATVTAQWKITITYEDGYENEAAESQQVNRGKSISLPEYVGPTHEGQTFAGWKIPNDEKIYAVGANVSFNENATVTAQWAKSSEEVVNITFKEKVNGGNEVVQKVKSGTAIVLPGDLFTANDKVITGWSIGSTYYKAGTDLAFSAATTAIACWSPKKVTVNFKDEDGRQVAEPQQVDIGSTISLPDYNEDHYTGWKISGPTDETIYAVGAEVSVNKDTTFVAQRENKDKLVSIQFLPNGGSGKDLTQQVEIGRSIILPGNIFEAPKGKIFAGWEINGETYPVGSSYTVNDDTGHDIYCYAQWIDPSGTIDDRFAWSYADGKLLITGEGELTEVPEICKYLGEYIHTITFGPGIEDVSAEIFNECCNVRKIFMQSKTDIKSQARSISESLSSDATRYAIYLYAVNEDDRYDEHNYITVQHTILGEGVELPKSDDAPIISDDVPSNFDDLFDLACTDPSSPYYVTQIDSDNKVYKLTNDNTLSQVNNVVIAVHHAAEGNEQYVCTACELKKKYNITFVNDDGTVLKAAQLYVYGTSADDIEKPNDPQKAATARYTYTFSGWTPAIEDVTGDKTYTAKYNETTNKYTVKFINDGTELQNSAWPYGETPKYTGATPTKEPTDEYTYTFDKWTPEIVPVTSAAEYKATYKSEARTYTIIFVDEDGTVLKAAKLYAYGTLAGNIEKPSDPQKAATAQYTYTFAGWTPAIEDVTGDKTYTATYNNTTNKYTITFVNDDGTVLKAAQLYVYGTSADDIEKPNDPQKAATARYTYTFSGWSPAIAKVTKKQTYTATYSQTTNKYTIKFVNDDGTELQSSAWSYGETPKYTGATPTKASTAEFTYAFAGWTPAIEVVTGNATYKAVYTAKDSENKTYHMITFVDWDGQVLSEKYYQENTPADSIKRPANPSKASTDQYTYTFDKWTPEIVSVTSAATYKATYNSHVRMYTIIFVDEDGTVLKAAKLYAYGTLAGNIEKPSDPQKAATAQYTYKFTGWSPEIADVIQDQTYTATYSKVSNKYKFTFVDDDGTVLQSGEIDYGKTPSYTGKLPTKTSDDYYHYEFVEWKSESASVDGDVVYKAVYKREQHSIKIIDAKSPTCTETGLTEGKQCSVCKKVLKAQEIVPALGHDWDDGIVTTEPTCENDGVKTYICNRDSSHTYTEVIPAKAKQVVRKDYEADEDPIINYIHNSVAESNIYKTTDTVSTKGLLELELLMMISLIGLYFSFRKKKI